MSSNILKLLPCFATKVKFLTLTTALLKSAMLISGLGAPSAATAKDTPDEQQQMEIAALYLDLIQDLPESAVLLNSPYPQALEVYGGAKAKIDNKSVIKGGRALRIKSGKVKRDAYAKGAKTATIDSISKGDTLCLIYWARSINAPEDNLLAAFASVGVQQSKKPYTRVMGKAVDLTYEWTPYSQKATATEDYAAADAEVYFHFGHLKQRFEIGPVYLFNLGKQIAQGFESNACGKTS